MSIQDALGYNGIFICEKCMNSMNLSKDQIDAVKGYSDKPNKTDFRCHVCNQLYKFEEGVFVLPSKMADLIETSVNKIDEKYQEIRNGTLTCTKCGLKTEHNNKSKIECSNCKNILSLKDELKKYKLGFVKKTAMMVYVRSLRKVK